MSKTKIDHILNKAANKVAKVLGNKCQVYRPLDYMNPMDIANSISPKYGAFILDEKFSKTVDYKFQVFNVEVDTTDVRAGDIFVDGSDIYVILSAREAEACKAYLATTLITINRPVYGSTVNGAFMPVPVPIAEGVPANVYSVKGSSVANFNEGKQSSGKQVDYEMRIFTNEPILLIGDQLVDTDGNKSVVSSVEYGPLGYVVIAQSV